MDMSNDFARFASQIEPDERLAVTEFLQALREVRATGYGLISITLEKGELHKIDITISRKPKRPPQNTL